MQKKTHDFYGKTLFFRNLAVPVHWVPIVDRKSTDVAIDPIEAAFRKTNQIDQIHKEKFVRIGKMLNVSAFKIQSLAFERGFFHLKHQ